jgi:hypothetical protein
VVAGAERFETADVSGPGAWFQAGAFSGAPGDDVAIVEGGSVRLLDPVDFSERQRIPLGDALGGWGWSSRLARLGDRLVIVQTGGGFSKTEVRELDGRPVFAYQPDPDLPPGAFRPADLDGDGALELYAAGHDGLARLDATGRVVWTQRAPVDGIAQMLPRRADAPAWIVATSYGRPVRVHDDNGVLLGERALPADAGVVGAVDLPPHGRVLVASGERGVQAIRLDGRVVLEIPLADFVATEAVGVTFEAGGAPVLALAAATRRHDVERWRLLLVDARGGVAYDEILAAPAGLLTARREDGGDTLLLHAGSLRVVRPRRETTRKSIDGATAFR